MSLDTSATVIQTQPGTRSSNIQVRNLRDTPEDAEFAAKLYVEGFQGKFVHNITESKLPIAIKNQTAKNRGQDEAFYNRTFVAELSGQPVGLLQLQFKGDKHVVSDDHVNELGCWHGLRYSCLGSAMTEEVGKNSECYLDGICVSESARGKGVGKVLMQRAEQEARSRNCSVIYLYVMTTNRAVHLYEREGYSITMTASCCISCCLGPPGKVYKMEKSLQ